MFYAHIFTGQLPDSWKQSFGVVLYPSSVLIYKNRTLRLNDMSYGNDCPVNGALHK